MEFDNLTLGNKIGFFILCAVCFSLLVYLISEIRDLKYIIAEDINSRADFIESVIIENNSEKEECYNEVHYGRQETDKEVSYGERENAQKNN